MLTYNEFFLPFFQRMENFERVTRRARYQRIDGHFHVEPNYEEPMEVELEIHAIRRPRQPYDVREAARIQRAQRLAAEMARVERLRLEQLDREEAGMRDRFEQMFGPRMEIERKERDLLRSEIEKQQQRGAEIERQREVQAAIDRKELARLQNEIEVQRAAQIQIDQQREHQQAEAERQRAECERLRNELRDVGRPIEHLRVTTTTSGHRIENWGHYDDEDGLQILMSYQPGIFLSTNELIRVILHMYFSFQSKKKNPDKNVQANPMCHLGTLKKRTANYRPLPKNQIAPRLEYNRHCWRLMLRFRELSLIFHQLKNHRKLRPRKNSM